jgi:hypothetical protein
MGTDPRFEGKQIPKSEFNDDDGQADPAVIAALRGYRAGTVARSQVLNVLLGSRLFVPVKAVLDSVEVTDTGQQVEKDSHMATVSVQAADGRRALLAFTSVITMAQWDREARPVAARAQTTAAAARGEGADALLVDFGSEHTFVIEGDSLETMAKGEAAWVAILDPAVQAAVIEVVAPIARQFDCQFELVAPHGEADIRLAVIAPDDLDVENILHDVTTGLRTNDVLREKLAKGVELGVSRVSDGHHHHS